MNRNKWISIILISIVAVFLAYAAVIPQTYQKQIEVPYSFIKINEQLTLPVNIAKWFFPFSSAGITGATYEDTALLKISSGEYHLQLNRSPVTGAFYTSGRNERKKNFLFSILPDSSGNEAKVVMTYKSTLLNKWLGRNELETNAVLSLEQLKARMEDTKSLYGFDIKYEQVIDTSFLFKTKTVGLVQKATAMKELFDELLQVAEIKHAEHNGVRIFYSQPISNQQVELYAGIGVTRRIETKPGEPIQYKMMPAGKNLLSAFYQGPYGRVQEAYEALQEFKSDHKLNSMAIPFEKFIGNEYSFTDSQTVQLKVYYPIF